MTTGQSDSFRLITFGDQRITIFHPEEGSGSSGRHFEGRRWISSGWIHTFGHGLYPHYGYPG